MRRTIVAAAASAALALGALVATDSPASAWGRSGYSFSLSFGYPYGHYYSPYPRYHSYYAPPRHLVCNYTKVRYKTYWWHHKKYVKQVSGGKRCYWAYGW